MIFNCNERQRHRRSNKHVGLQCACGNEQHQYAVGLYFYIYYESRTRSTHEKKYRKKVN